MNTYKSTVPDIVLAGDFNFPKAIWNAGIGNADAETPSNKGSLEKLLGVAADLNLLQKISEGTRTTRNGKQNVLELIFTNNHEMISNIFIEPSVITDHKYIICETSHNITINEQTIYNTNEHSLSSYNYLKADWESIKVKIKETLWTEILAE